MRALLGHTCPWLQGSGGPRCTEQGQPGGEGAQFLFTLLSRQLASPWPGRS